MTYEEFSKLPFKLSVRMSLEDVHSSIYDCTDPRFGERIRVCDHVPVVDGEFKGKSFRRWQIDGMVYRSKKKLIEAIKDL